MRLLVGVAILCITLPLQGCALFQDAAHLMTFKVREKVEDCCERQRNRRWADQAWEAAEKSPRAGGYSADYAKGFKQGYADYLYEGGNSEEPPLVAPLHYRSHLYQTPQGYIAIQDWFDGYRHGAGMARASGIRQLITGPTSLANLPLNLPSDQKPLLDSAMPQPKATLGRPIESEFAETFSTVIPAAQDGVAPCPLPTGERHQEGQNNNVDS